MESEQYYKSLLALFDYVAVEGHKVITLAKGTELCGEYWVEIRNRMKNGQMGRAPGDGSFEVTLPQKLYPLHTESLRALERIAREKEDRDLDNRSKKVAIIYSKWAIAISILSLIVSVIAIILKRT